MPDVEFTVQTTPITLVVNSDPTVNVTPSSDSPINLSVDTNPDVLVSVGTAGIQGPQGTPGSGSVSGDFYPASNPSGFITGIPNVVYTTGEQTISGRKTFADEIYTMGSVIIDGTGFLEFAAGAPAWKEGRVFYDSGSHALSYYNNNSNVTVNIGQEQMLGAVNGEADTMLNGSIVYISGARGNTPTMYRASNTSSSQSHKVVGMVTCDTPTNQMGYITTFGIVHGLNTNAFDEGTVFYLGTGGQPTTIQPAPPNHVVDMGWVLRQHQNHGEVFINIHKWLDLGELCDISISGIQSGQTLIYDSSKMVWSNQNTVLPSQTGEFLTYPRLVGVGGIQITQSGNSVVFSGSSSGGAISSGASEAWVDANYYPRTNPSGFEPAHFGVNFSIARSGDYITGIQYADSSMTKLYYNSSDQITGIHYGTYKKLILYGGDLITGVEYL